MKRKVEWVEHSGDQNPIPGIRVVVYRTRCVDDNGGSKISHIHGPVHSTSLVWSYKPAIGRIYQYAIVR